MLDFPLPHQTDPIEPAMLISSYQYDLYGAGVCVWGGGGVWRGGVELVLWKLKALETIFS